MANQYTGLYFANRQVESDFIAKNKKKTEINMKINYINIALNSYQEWYSKIDLQIALGDSQELLAWAQNYFEVERDPDWYRANNKKQPIDPYSLTQPEIELWVQNAKEPFNFLENLIKIYNEERKKLVLPCRTITYREWKKVPLNERSTC